MPRATPPPPPSQGRTRARFRTPFISQPSSSQAPSSQAAPSQVDASQAAHSQAAHSQVDSRRVDPFRDASSQTLVGNFHPIHNIPTDDIILAFNNGVRFRVSSHRLARESDHFKEMFGTEGVDHRDDILVDFHSTTICVFLNIVSVSVVYPLGLDYHEISKLVDLLTEYGCLGILPRVQAQFREAIRKNGYIAFQWASHRNDVDLAREALRGCTNSWTYSKSAPALKEYVRGIAKIWKADFYELVWGMYRSRVRGGGRLQGYCWIGVE